MPELVVCPECGGQLNVPDRLLGKKVKCSTCKAIFEAKAPPREEIADAEDVEEVGDAEDVAQRIRKHVGAAPPGGPNAPAVLFWARLSALLLFIASAVSLGAVGFLMLFDLIMVVVMISSSGTSYSLFEAMYWMTVLVVGIPGLLATLAADTGVAFGLFGPRRKNAFGLCIATLAVSGVHLLFLLVGLAVADGPSSKLGIAPASQRASEASRLATTLLALETSFMPYTDFDVMFFLTALLEVARLILLALFVRAVLRNYKRDDNLWLVNVIAAGGGALLLLLIGLVVRLSLKSASSESALKAIGLIHYLFPDLVVAAIYGAMFLLCMRLRTQLGYEKPE
jgi:hypothetical protein